MVQNVGKYNFFRRTFVPHTECAVRQNILKPVTVKTDGWTEKKNAQKHWSVLLIWYRSGTVPLSKNMDKANI